MKQYDLIIFDWDGTLMDSTQHIINCMQLAIKQLVFPPLSERTVSNIIGLGLNEAIFTLYPDLSETDRKQLGLNYQQNWLNSPYEAPLFDNATKLIHHLHQQDYFLGVATGKGRSGLNKVLKSSLLGPLFHATRCVDECYSKPHPEMIEQLMSYLGVRPNRTLMVGDTSHDLNMAHNARADCIAVTHGAHDSEALRACKPKYIAKNLYQVQQWLSN